MTRIKMCGLKSEADIDYVNRIRPEFIGFVFVPGSKRFITHRAAAALHSHLNEGILSVGVFANVPPDYAADLVSYGIIDFIQLHGNENNGYIADLRGLTHAPIIQAFQVRSEEDILAAEHSDADIVLLDSGAGSGELFDHSLISGIKRPYILAGGLSPENVGEIVRTLSPFAVDVSSAIGTDGAKDYRKMKAFSDAVRDI